MDTHQHPQGAEKGHHGGHAPARGFPQPEGAHHQHGGAEHVAAGEGLPTQGLAVEGGGVVDLIGPGEVQFGPEPAAPQEHHGGDQNGPPEALVFRKNQGGHRHNIGGVDDQRQQFVAPDQGAERGGPGGEPGLDGAVIFLVHGGLLGGISTGHHTMDRARNQPKGEKFWQKSGRYWAYKAEQKTCLLRKNSKKILLKRNRLCRKKFA